MQRNLLLLGLSLSMTCQGDSSGFPSAWWVHLLALVCQASLFFFLLRFLACLYSSLFLIRRVVRGEHLVNNTCRLCNGLVWAVLMSAASYSWLLLPVWRKYGGVLDRKEHVSWAPNYGKGTVRHGCPDSSEDGLHSEDISKIPALTITWSCLVF